MKARISKSNDSIQRKDNGKGASIAPPSIQRKENNTGMPDHLKSGIENLSGIDMSDVKVHYNSSQPAQLNAHAYAQGNQIHIAPGQQKHLPHEAWHVVQQKQGRVKPTKQLKEKIDVNDDGGLEREADVMGNKALGSSIQAPQFKSGKHSVFDSYPNGHRLSTSPSTVQLKLTFVSYTRLSVDIEDLESSVDGIFLSWNSGKITHNEYLLKVNEVITRIQAIADKEKDDFTLERRLKEQAKKAVSQIRSRYIVANLSAPAPVTSAMKAVPAVAKSGPIKLPQITSGIKSDLSGTKFRQLQLDISESLLTAKSIYTSWIHHKLSIGEYLDKILNLRNYVLKIPGKAIEETTYYKLLTLNASKTAAEISRYINHREDIDMLNRLLDSPRFPDRGRQIIYRTHLPEDAISALGTSLGEIEKWLLLHEDVGEKDEFGTRFDVMESIAEVLMPYREMVKKIIPGARIKYRGSLVRGLKGYPKGGVKVSTKAYDCDAFIEVPSEFWLDMRTKGAKGIERDPEGNPTGGKVDIRGYEPLKQISFASRENPEQMKYRIIIQKLLEIEQHAAHAVEAAQKGGKLKGYKYGETGKIDFEFFIRAVYNTTTTYHEGNPYLKGQVRERGYPALEEELGISPVPEFTKKKDAPDKRETLGPYVEEHGPMGVVMPEYQAVLGKHGWYLETEELMEWRLLKRQLDSYLKEKTKYPRTSLPQYTKSLLPAFDSPYSSAKASAHSEEHHELYDLIAIPEVIHFSIELKNLNTLMSSVKIFDAQTNILSISKPEMIPVIIEKYNTLNSEFVVMEKKYPALTSTPVGIEWFGLIERTFNKINEANELMDMGGSKKIVRDHSKEKPRK